MIQLSTIIEHNEICFSTYTQIITYQLRFWFLEEKIITKTQSGSTVSGAFQCLCVGGRKTAEKTAQGAYDQQTEPSTFLR